jgi:hypothetical protein
VPPALRRAPLAQRALRGVRCAVTPTLAQGGPLCSSAQSGPLACSNGNTNLWDTAEGTQTYRVGQSGQATHVALVAALPWPRLPGCAPGAAPQPGGWRQAQPPQAGGTTRVKPGNHVATGPQVKGPNQ